MPVLDTAERAAFRQLMGGQISDSDIREMAKTASDAYIDQQVDPNETIQKLASQHELNPQFIARVAEATNVNIYGELFKRAAPSERADITFPLARAPEITHAVAPDPPGAPLQVKVASADVDMTDFHSAPPSVLRRPFEPEAHVKEARAPSRPHPKYARMYLGKLASTRQDEEGEVLDALQKLGAAETALHRELKTMMITEPDEVVEFYRDACHLELGKEASAAIAKVAASMPSARVKTAAMADEKYLPDEDPARVVNGETRVLKLLRAVDQRRCETENRWGNLQIIDHSRERMLSRVHDLRS